MIQGGMPLFCLQTCASGAAQHFPRALSRHETEAVAHRQRSEVPDAQVDCGFQALPPEACELSNLQLLGLSGTMLSQKLRAAQRAGCCNLADLPLHKVLRFVCIYVVGIVHRCILTLEFTCCITNSNRICRNQPSSNCSDSLPCCSM
jgi:hypothetical protein